MALSFVRSVVCTFCLLLDVLFCRDDFLPLSGDFVVFSIGFGLACTGLRFFTVYGPWGRPDMALFLFTRAIMEQKPIKVFNHGKMQRDFTYIDDIIEGVVRVMDRLPEPNTTWSGDDPDPGTSYVNYRIYNFSIFVHMNRMPGYSFIRYIIIFINNIIA